MDEQRSQVTKCQRFVFYTTKSPKIRCECLMFWIGLILFMALGLSVGLVVGLHGDELDRESPKERCENAQCITAACTVIDRSLLPVYRCGKNSALYCRKMQLIVDAETIAEEGGSNPDLGAGSFEGWDATCRETKEEETNEDVCGIYPQIQVNSSHACWLHPTERNEDGRRRVLFFDELDETLADARAADPVWLIVIICLGAVFGMGSLLLLVIFTLITHLHCCDGGKAHDDDERISAYFAMRGGGGQEWGG